MVNTHRLYLDVHAIQSVPPSNINRDDTGSPKTALYGGARRARVSSQAWKKAMRDYFYSNSEQKNVGVRTLEIIQYVAKQIRQLEDSITDEEAMKLAEKVINTAGVKTSNQRAKALFFLGEYQAKGLAEAAVKGVNDKATIQSILRDDPAIDIALFGRMVADDPSLNEDASSQVAHAISTHGVQTEFDFYTAIDDLSPEDNAGAGMLGTIEFNASTLYRYANVSVHALFNQLNNKQATIDTLKLFIEAFSNSMPTGKVNTFANQTLPQAILVTLRKDRPVNLVTAFEKPIHSSKGYVHESIVKLCQEHQKVQRFVREPETTLLLSFDELAVEGIEKVVDSLDDLQKTLAATLERVLSDEPRD